MRPLPETSCKRLRAREAVSDPLSLDRCGLRPCPRLIQERVAGSTSMAPAMSRRATRRSASAVEPLRVRCVTSVRRFTSLRAGFSAMKKGEDPQSRFQRKSYRVAVISAIFTILGVFVAIKECSNSSAPTYVSVANRGEGSVSQSKPQAPSVKLGHPPTRKPGLPNCAIALAYRGFWLTHCSPIREIL